MASETMLMMLIVLPFAGACFAALFPANARNAETWAAALVTLGTVVLSACLFPSVATGTPVRLDIEWLPTLGLSFSLRMDGFAWLFAMLVSTIGFLVVIYSRYYMSPDDAIPRFYAFFLAFMGAMLGIILSGNLILLVVFWELTSIISFMLIGYWYQKADARDGARMSLTITGIGGLGLLAGVLLIGHIVGSYDLDVVLDSGDLIRSHPLYLTATCLILLGAFTKSAQFPFHFWLPNAMAAPTPVSAFLHSATMVKAGVFLMARLWPVLGGTYEWFWLTGFAGAMSLLLGAYFAIFQRDIKGLLAYSTISHLGLITLLLSLGSPLGAVAAIFHMMNHATFKASLFMAAGIIDHESGTRDMQKLGGLFKLMPYTATLAMVASAAMAGVPLLNGFLSKEMFFAEAIETHADSILDTAAPYVAVLASAFAVTYSMRFIHAVFFGDRPDDLPREPHEPPFLMRLPIQLLVLACLVIGIFPALTVGPFLHVAVVSVLGEETPAYSLAVWHGLTLPLVMSIIALLGGALLYVLLRHYLAHCEEGPPYFRRLKGQRIFERALVFVSWRGAKLVETTFGTRRLQQQLRLLIGVALVAAFIPRYNRGFDLGVLQWGQTDIAFGLLWMVGIACAVGAAYQAKFHRLVALILLGGAGVVTCITFVWLSAPDLAVTQLLVEIVTAVLILLGLRWLPKRWEDTELGRAPLGTKVRRGRDLLLAAIAGLGMTLLSYAVMMRPSPDSISEFFLLKAYEEGGGRNVVNVILVDFRGFDTFGEITVLGIVALTVFALFRRFRPAPDTIDSPEQQRIQAATDEARSDRIEGQTVSDYLLVPSVIMQWLFPVIIVLAAYLFLRGHDLPGGGFAAGVAMSAAFILQYLAAGTVWVEDRLRILPVNWIGLGLLIAACVGIGSWVFGYPFLTSYSQYVDLPVIGKVPAATAILFDLGVFSLVVGATVLMLIVFAHQSIRRLRAAKISTTTMEEIV
ncbi:monovalent cation/H+ antiporter subunit A [Tianweitania sp.]|uniref:monovalent cation/H+ antiporter subunit A n=1 Tax=Tianweitania sp. TaxID=2021634 RepID=UPI0028A2CA73|nr:monovalent cation/H+ antiporter subunit A [Tianweitania sp.]